MLPNHLTTSHLLSQYICARGSKFERSPCSRSVPPVSMLWYPFSRARKKKGTVTWAQSRQGARGASHSAQRNEGLTTKSQTLPGPACRAQRGPKAQRSQRETSAALFYQVLTRAAASPLVAARAIRRALVRVVKPVRRACARGSKFGQDASLTNVCRARPVGRAQCERNAVLLA